MRVVRVQLDNGDRVVGIKYPELLIPLVEKSIQEQKIMERAMQQQLNSTVSACLFIGEMIEVL